MNRSRNALELPIYHKGTAGDLFEASVIACLFYATEIQYAAHLAYCIENEICGKFFFDKKLGELFDLFLKSEKRPDHAFITRKASILGLDFSIIAKAEINHDNFILYAATTKAGYIEREAISFCSAALKKAAAGGVLDLADFLEKVNQLNSKILSIGIEKELSPEEQILEFIKTPKRGDNFNCQILSNLDVLPSRGDLFIIGARPSHGKTALALQFFIDDILATPNGNTHYCFYSCEMTKHQIIGRIIQRLIGFSMRNSLKDDEAGLYEALLPLYQEKLALILSRLHILTANEMPPEKIEHHILSLKAKGIDIKAVCIDYIQIAQVPDEVKLRDRNTQITALSRAYKKIALKHDIVFVCLSQVSRESTKGKKWQDRMPNIAQLRDSGAIEQDADIVVMLYNIAHDKDAECPESIIYEDKDGNSQIVHRYDTERRAGAIALKVEKNRSGISGILDMPYYIGQHLLFITPNEYISNKVITTYKKTTKHATTAYMGSGLTQEEKAIVNGFDDIPF